MKTLACRIVCIASLIGVLISILYCRCLIVEENTQLFGISQGDYVLIDPHHTLGKVAFIHPSGEIEVHYTNRMGVSKTIIIPPNRLHKVIFMESPIH